MKTNGLATLDAQIESIAAALREIGARLEAIKATAYSEVKLLRETLEHRASGDDLDRIVPLKQAAKLRGVSVDTLTRTSRDKFIAISSARFGMRVRDALLKD
jgi:hypothetical protein